MADTIACDVSYYQPIVTDAYPHPWLIFRISDGSYLDTHREQNLAWCKANYGKKLVGYSGYSVYRPGVDIVSVAKGVVGAHAPDGFTFMIDVESWGGQITGDHSTEINKRAEDAATWLGSKNRVLVYANTGDFQTVYPHENPGFHYIVAKYSSEAPTHPAMIGWQYTDGEQQWSVPSGAPRASAPFGACDHNIFPGLSPADLAAKLGLTKSASAQTASAVKSTATTKDVEDMTPDELNAHVDKRISLAMQALMHGSNDEPFKSADHPRWVGAPGKGVADQLKELHAK